MAYDYWNTNYWETNFWTTGYWATTLAPIISSANKIIAALKLWKRLHCKGGDNGRCYSDSNSC